MKLLKFIPFLLLALIAQISFVSCDPNEVPEENEEEIITDVELTFTSAAGTIKAKAFDPDGEGPLPIAINDSIALVRNTLYTLNIEVLNSIANEDITEEISEEADEHQFFFGFPNSMFSNPSGDGNIDAANDPVNYSDKDSKNLPLGLQTTWNTGDVNVSGSFRIILKHQPDGLKTGGSSATVGDTDIDLSFPIFIQ